jgi:hypothetical protein
LLAIIANFFDSTTNVVRNSFFASTQDSLTFDKDSSILDKYFVNSSILYVDILTTVLKCLTCPYAKALASINPYISSLRL